MEQVQPQKFPPKTNHFSDFHFQTGMCVDLITADDNSGSQQDAGSSACVRPVRTPVGTPFTFGLSIPRTTRKLTVSCRHAANKFENNK